eukprot:CAMPEP_0117014864 /NCGR_PEP_ID=MMETSP0472-20121206/11981_1 /TAXON_ID=693140 ORGANISM="Tiarina fusus, Strain LIS" /NCGR_SAMPLE_ID=MMETSP0472 /ASSEMBLY_ACC=CAM_ASM_000603 /LENGTH=953 /DNA_ID=CAMNT_0004718533 /DNA_START=69 /DNA_END=2930 /DNA_ORIENTATION=+
MASRGRPDGIFSGGGGGGNPFALLVDAANAQSRSEEERQQIAAALGESQRSASESHHRAAAAAADAASRQQHNLGELELQEALQREALQRRAALMGFGGGGGGGFPGGLQQQDAEYLQQLRLEALVQQRRQETLAQLALAQETGMSQDIHALFQAQQLRQAGLMRQEMLGVSGLPPGYEQLGGLGGHLAAQEENAYLQHLLEEREKQAKLAALASAGGMNVAGLSAAEQQFSVPEESRVGPDVVGSALEKQKAQREPEAVIPQDDGSKTTVLPCRARGMPMDHNVKTAYFVIQEDIKHGTELVCSYFACRNAGIKFRYCTYCKLPVAKRNFCKRHKHTGKIPASNMVKDLDMNGNDDSSSEESQNEIKKPPPPKKVVEPVVVKEIKLKPPAKTKAEMKKAAKARALRVKKRTLQISANDALKGLVGQGIEELEQSGAIKKPLSSEETKQLVEARGEKWEELLNKRPRYDRDAMLFWVQDILATSDFDTPLEGEEESIAEGASKMEEDEQPQNESEPPTKKPAVAENVEANSAGSKSVIASEKAKPDTSTKPEDTKDKDAADETLVEADSEKQPIASTPMQVDTRDEIPMEVDPVARPKGKPSTSGKSKKDKTVSNAAKRQSRTDTAKRVSPSAVSNGDPVVSTPKDSAPAAKSAKIERGGSAAKKGKGKYLDEPPMEEDRVEKTEEEATMESEKEIPKTEKEEEIDEAAMDESATDETLMEVDTANKTAKREKNQTTMKDVKVDEGEKINKKKNLVVETSKKQEVVEEAAHVEVTEMDSTANHENVADRTAEQNGGSNCAKDAIMENAKETKKKGRKALMARKELDDFEQKKKETSDKGDKSEVDDEDANEEEKAKPERDSAVDEGKTVEEANEEPETKESPKDLKACGEGKGKDVEKTADQDKEDEEENDEEEYKDDESDAEEMSETKEKIVSDDASTSSEDSVDLRANKRK